MTKADAVEVLKLSFSQPSATPDHGARDRERFLATEREKLFRLVIDPVKVKAVPSAWAKQYAVLRNESYEMFAIAGEGATWLLFDAATKEYALASGSLQSGSLELLGFSSPDALTEWRG